MCKNKERQTPVIDNITQVAKSKLFTVEQLDLSFSNGEQRQYERIKGGGRGAVLVVPVTEQREFILVREYCAGTHDYQLGFPKGLIDPGETPEQAGDRELKEEAGFGANALNLLKKVSLAPSYFNAHMSILLAQDLYPAKLEGDEPEPLEVVTWPTSQWRSLLSQPDFTEARSVAALMLALDWLENNTR